MTLMSNSTRTSWSRCKGLFRKIWIKKQKMEMMKNTSKMHEVKKTLRTWRSVLWRRLIVITAKNKKKLNKKNSTSTTARFRMSWDNFWHRAPVNSYWCSTKTIMEWTLHQVKSKSSEEDGCTKTVSSVRSRVNLSHHKQNRLMIKVSQKTGALNLVSSRWTKIKTYRSSNLKSDRCMKTWELTQIHRL